MRQSSYEEFEATSLYCPRCKAAVPVRKRLLLVLPEGDEYEYLCAYCSSSVGIKVDKNAPQIELVLKPWNHPCQVDNSLRTALKRISKLSFLMKKLCR